MLQIAITASPGGSLFSGGQDRANRDRKHAMVILRRTQKLDEKLPCTVRPSADSDTALGDWYVNRMTIDRRPLLLLVSSQSLLPIVIPARDVRTLPNRLAAVVARRLERLQIPPCLIEAEVEAMAPVVVAPTVDRSVVGIMVDFAKAVPFYLEPGGWDETTLPFVEAHLGETPCHAGKRRELVIFPDQAARAILATRWNDA